MDSKLLATIIAVAKKEAGTQARDLSALEAKVEKQLQEFHKRSPILETPSFFVKDGCLHCKWQSGLVLDFGNIVGPQGAQGIQGPLGATGKPGKDGKDGLSGVAGLNGKHGSDGAVGASGKHGVDGRDGNTGSQGLQGPKGPAGNKGDKGISGLPGVDGTDGRTGADGLDGDDGVGVEKAWVNEDYHLTIKLTSGKVIDAGYVRGPSGTSAGKGGRVTGGYTGGGSGSNFYVTGSRYDENGDLIITMSNGQTVRADLPTGQGVVYIQDATPTSNNPYLWIQTNVNTDGDFSFWFNNC